MTSFRITISLTLLFVCSLATVGCSDEPGPSNPADAQTDTMADAGGADSSGDTDSCTPKTCADIAGACGVQQDGCGGQLDCGACGCSPSTYQQDCRPQPCMEAVGCSDSGECEYAPIRCGGETCDSCVDGSCDDDEVRTCGGSGACPVAFCDPSPVVEDGVTTYQNTCRAEASIRCGVCGLGSYQCGADQSFSCVEPPVPGVDQLDAECNSTARPTFVYLDAVYQGDDSDGSRERPYTTFAEAFDRVRNVDASALIIGGAERLVVPEEPSGRADAPNYGFVVPEGISILGGYTGWPDFAPDPSMRPTIYAAHSNIALEAADITEATTVANLDIENSRDAVEDTSYGAVIRRSPGLTLRDVTIVANEPPRAGRSVDVAEPTPQVVAEITGDWEEETQRDLIYGSSSPGVEKQLGCSFQDAQAEAAFGFADYPDERTGYAEGGLGGSAPSNEGQRDDGWRGSDPINRGYEARYAEDATPYVGGERFAANGASGSDSGQLDVDRLWREATGGEFGAIGAVGPSGAGGASGLTKDFSGVRYEPNNDYMSNGQLLYGARGGTGGLGGCGGVGGRPGSGGHWTIGVLLDESPNTEFSGVEFQISDAGPGQVGSIGGAPTEGGFGERTSYRAFYYYECGNCLRRIYYGHTSQNGGDGAAGQWGGHGGHGAGGSVVGVLCADTTLADTAGMTFELGEPGDGASGMAPGAPTGMTAPADAPAGVAAETYQCDPPAEP